MDVSAGRGGEEWGRGGDGVEWGGGVGEAKTMETMLARAAAVAMAANEDDAFSLPTPLPSAAVQSKQ